MAKQSDLEKVGFERRAEELTRSDYNKTNMYSEEHEDAKSHDDANHPWGKGGEGDYTHTVPQAYNNATKNAIKPQIGTTNAGGSYDKFGYNGVGGRQFLMTISKYSSAAPYYDNGVVNIDTTANIEDGQYYVK